MNMKSNQRREAEQPFRSKRMPYSLRNMAETEDKNRSSGVSYSLLTKSRHLNDQVEKSKTLFDSRFKNNQYSAKANKLTHIDRKLSPLSAPSLDNQINDKNSEQNLEKFTQTMYNLTSLQSKSNKRYTNVVSSRRRRQAINASKILNESLSIINRSSLILVVIALALSSCIYITQVQAFQSADGPDAQPSSSSSLQSSSASSPSQSLASSVASSALSSLSSAIISAALQDGKTSSTDKSNSPASNVASETVSSGSSTSPVGSSSPTSIAASLSSAVASAAAAAAVAAAQSSLTGSDARSLLSSPTSNTLMSSSNAHHSNHHHHHSRNTGLNLALKLADAIPEVPYNILHNMKKLDHAAPFYNVGNKVSYSGNSKESTHSFLSSALHASGGLGGAAEQLSSLFRSPIWKRIADGYGEFTSEFRSLFRAPPTPMKGSTSSTSKLLRDISVPALLMILASTIPSDWRPVRTRRKSLVPSDLATAYHLVDPMTASSSSDLPNYSVTPQLFASVPSFNIALQQQQQIIPQQQQQNFGRGLYPSTPLYNQMDNSAPVSNQARINDIDLQQADTASTVAWMPPSVVAQSEPTSQMHNYETQMGQIQLHQHNPIQQQQQTHQQLQQSIRRYGDSLPTNLGPSPSDAQLIHSGVKPVNSGRLLSNSLSGSSSSVAPSDSMRYAAGSLFSSLTSGLANQVGHSKLMNRITNANAASIGSDNLQPVDSHRMGISSMNRELKLHKDHLNDKHRYSLVDNDDDDIRSRSNINGHQQALSPTKPFLLSAMTQALGSILPKSYLKSGSMVANQWSNSNAGLISNKMFTLTGNNDNNNLQNSLIGDKTINHHETILRRNHQSPGAMEQRELSKLIPQSWREVVKRTVNSVQEQATTQWRSIEGQLANWVQDKLKTIPAAGATSSGNSSSSSGSAAPVANILATVGSTALNMLGFGGKNSAGSTNSSNLASSPNGGESTVNPTSEESSSPTPVLKNKYDSTKLKQPTAKASLAGVANMIVSTLSNRPVTSQPSSKSKIHTSIADTSSASTRISQYPTLTGVGAAQFASSLSSSSSSDLVEPASQSAAASTASTTAGVSSI